jgi:hypothetical protein
MNRMRVLVLALLLATTLPTGAHGQAWRASVLALAPAEEVAPGQASAPVAPATPESSRTLLSRRQPGLFKPIIGGMVGGTVGIFTGALIGQNVTQKQAGEIYIGAVYGLLIGETLLLPVGVHAGNNEQGSLLADFAVSTGVGTTAVLIGTRSDLGSALLVGVFGQFIAVVATERATGKRRSEHPAILAAPAEPLGAADLALGDSALTFRPPNFEPMRTQPPLVFPIVAGVAIGAAAGYAGALIGDRSRPAYDEIPVGAALGFLAGETVGLPLGVHAGNAFHGSFLGDLGVSAAGQALAIGLGLITSSSVGYAIGLGAQVALTVRNERRVAARHDAEVHLREP